MNNTLKYFGILAILPLLTVSLTTDYFTDADGFSKKMAPMSEPGMIWLDGIFTVRDSNAKQHMLAVYARMKSLGQAYERGLMRFTDETSQFAPITRGGPEFLLYSSAGHPFGIRIGPTRYCGSSRTASCSVAPARSTKPRSPGSRCPSTRPRMPRCSPARRT